MEKNVETLVLCKPSKLCRIQKVYITASRGNYFEFLLQKRHRISTDKTSSTRY